MQERAATLGRTRSRRRTLRAAAAIAAVLLVLGVAAYRATPSSQAWSCPRALALPPNPLAPATQAALNREPARTMPRVLRAALAPNDGAPRAHDARRECGDVVWRRTVVVYLELRAYLPSASLSSRIVLVARTPRGYVVWRVVH